MLNVRVGSEKCSTYADTTATTRLDRPRAVTVTSRNGTTSPPIDRRPCLPHTHRRFNSNDGIVATIVAMTLAATAPAARVATIIASTDCATVTDTTDTAAYRRSFHTCVLRAADERFRSQHPLTTSPARA